MDIRVIQLSEMLNITRKMYISIRRSCIGLRTTKLLDLIIIYKTKNIDYYENKLVY